MSIQIGDTLPQGTFMSMVTEGPSSLSVDDVFGGKKVVLFAVPGAFTPGCSMTHLPGFLQYADAMQLKGVETVACLAVNDAFVMEAWANERQTNGRILMLADGNADYVKKLGLELDASKFGMGTRSKRFSMLVEDGVVTRLNVDASGIDKSSAENMLVQLSGSST